MTDLLITIEIRPILMILVNMGSRYGLIYNGLFLSRIILCTLKIFRKIKCEFLENVFYTFVEYNFLPFTFYPVSKFILNKIINSIKINQSTIKNRRKLVSISDTSVI